MKNLLIFALISLLTTGCAQRAVTTDFDPNYNFESIKSIHITSTDNLNESPSSRHIQGLVTQAMKSAGVNIDANAEVTLRTRSFTEERVNDQSISLGVGSGSRSGNSSIGIGTSVQIPIGDDMSEFQVIQLDLIDNGQVIWTANDAAKIKVKDGKGLHKVQEKLIARLLENFPLFNTEQ